MPPLLPPTTPLLLLTLPACEAAPKNFWIPRGAPPVSARFRLIAPAPAVAAAAATAIAASASSSVTLAKNDLIEGFPAATPSASDFAWLAWPTNINDCPCDPPGAAVDAAAAAAAATAMLSASDWLTCAKKLLIDGLTDVTAVAGVVALAAAADDDGSNAAVDPPSPLSLIGAGGGSANGRQYLALAASKSRSNCFHHPGDCPAGMCLTLTPDL